MELKFSKVERKGPITIITLSRPEVYNALHTDAHFELQKVFDDFSADPEQWVAIVTGAGDKAFCAGNDLKWQAAGGKRGWDKGGFAGLTARFDCDKPIIAAVNGVAMGGGFEIALACDLIIASENATFALPEPRVGPRRARRRPAPAAAADRIEARHGHDPHRAPCQRQGGLRARLRQRGGPARRGACGCTALGGDDHQELADVDPGVQADHPERASPSRWSRRSRSSANIRR